MDTSYTFEKLPEENYAQMLGLARKFYAARNAKMRLLRTEGQTLQEIAEAFGLSRQRVFQILARQERTGEV